MATFDEFYQSLPEDSNKRGELFEKEFVPWYLRNSPEWRNKIRTVWPWNDYPRRWGRDCGIDLVFEDLEGRDWAVQAKCISPKHEVTKAEIDSFLSESSDKRIYKRLLIASTSKIGRNAQSCLERQEKQVVRVFREHLVNSNLEFPKSINEMLTGGAKEKKRPKPHQKEAIKNVVEGLAKNDKGQLIMACGTGKTLTSLWIKEALNAKKVLVLVPSLSLLSQTLKEWCLNSNEDFNWLCVCSDKSVAKKKQSRDEWIENISQLGIDVTSESAEVERFLEHHDSGVIFSTYQSSNLVAQAQSNAKTNHNRFDITFADEAHRCAGKKSDTFGSIIIGDKIKTNKKLFMTATPKVLSSRIKRKAIEKDVEVSSMDDVTKFGKPFYELSFSRAIEDDLLNDYRVVIIAVDDQDEEILEKISRRRFVSTESGIENDFETIAHHICLQKAIIKYSIKRAITFHGSVEKAKSFAEDHHTYSNWSSGIDTKSQDLYFEYVSGKMPASERSRKLNALQETNDHQIGILANARCLSEGVDVPSLDGIAFIDPRRSQVDIIQAIGRAIRRTPGKSCGTGYIILPIYLGDTHRIEHQILASRFADVWKVMLALRSEDSSLGAELDAIRVELGRRRKRKVSISELLKVDLILPDKIDRSIIDSFTTLLVECTTSGWMESLGELIEFTKDSRLEELFKKNRKLYTWKQTQIDAYKLNKLTEDRIRKLEAVDGWSWDPRTDLWIQNYRDMVQYIRDNRHISPNTADEEIGILVANIRHRYNTNQLSQRRIRQLNRLPGWSWSVYDADWQRNYNLLKDFSDSHRHSFPDEKNHEHLYKWAKTQRVRMNRKTIKEYQIKLLESLPGWTWKIQSVAEEKNSRISEESLRYGDLTLDISRRELIHGEERISLTFVELSMLEIFMRNPGYVISSNKIFEHVRGHPPRANQAKDLKYIGTYITRLRSKISSGLHGSISIRTERGIGYSLQSDGN
ncbi:Putative Type IIC bifunctional restriction-modification protein with endonuclease and N6-adenine DNA methyltransferase activity [Synechococcus sp. A18-46.1]|nr:Putative Type IIC bifunctional restriction-modification protein with endonuclease and N6-adenine DNA methyltransferase activity [Synechococcus sp. A18-46.1]